MITANDIKIANSTKNLTSVDIHDIRRKRIHKVLDRLKEYEDEHNQKGETEEALILQMAQNEIKAYCGLLNRVSKMCIY